MTNQIEVKIDSLRVSLTNQQRIVILKQVNADRYLPIWIGPYEAEAITIALQEIEISRPQTHDLIKNVITKLGGVIDHIVINEIKDDIFYGLIIIQRSGKFVEIDSRPSDAIALAVRAHVPIYVSNEVMDIASILPETNVEMEEKNKPEEKTKQKRPSENLKPGKVGKILGDKRLNIFEKYLENKEQNIHRHPNDEDQEEKPTDDNTKK